MIYDWLYLIAKPPGITSFGVIARMRRIMKIKKIWHAGTLDPAAHGLMIVAVGRDYTRQISEYIGMDKSYVAKIKLWYLSETMDSEWPIMHHSDVIPTLEQITLSVQSQIQTYDQMPPSYSAKKIGWTPAYKLARAGKEVTLTPKQVSTSDAQLMDYQYPYVTVRYDVSSGTYIRVLAQELWLTVEAGWYCDQLCRVSIGGYHIDQAADLDELLELFNSNEIERMDEVLINGKLKL